MAFKVILKPIAYVDIDEAITWYEKKSFGLGKRFLLQVEDAKKRILENPTAFSLIKKPVRSCRVIKYPYKVFLFFLEKLFSLLAYVTLREAKHL